MPSFQTTTIPRREQFSAYADSSFGGSWYPRREELVSLGLPHTLNFKQELCPIFHRNSDLSRSRKSKGT